MVTAWHCSVGSADVFHTYPGTGVYVGSIVQSNQALDIALLAGASYGLSVYTGPYQSQTPSASITGIATALVGATVCMEGSLSGSVCNNKVTAIHKDIDYGPPVGVVHDLTLAVNQSGQAAAGSGDSGGPVLLSPASNGTVVGMIQGIQSPYSTCTGNTDILNRKCSTQVYFQTVSNVISEFNTPVG